MESKANIVDKCVALSNEAKTTHNDGKLRKFVSQLDVNMLKDTMHTVLTTNSMTSKAFQVAVCLYKGISGLVDEELKRFKITQQILIDLKKSKLSSKAMREEMLRVVILNIDKLTPEHLATLTTLCVKDIIDNSDEHLGWKEVLPKLLNVLVDVKEVIHNDAKISGADYKSRIIQSLCVADWQVEILTPLAIAFEDMTLTPAELQEIARKFCNAFDILPPEELVPLVQQLLIICKKQHGICIFFALQKYFTKWIYCAQPFSQDFDGIDVVDFRKEAPNALANILLCIYDSASQGHSIIKQLIKCAKSLINAPEKLIEPFLVTVFLSVLHIDSLKSLIIDILKSAFIRAIGEERRMVESAWVRKLVSVEAKISDVLIKVIDKSHDCEKSMKGMIELAFALFVPVSTSLKEAQAERLWALGQLMLVRIIRKKTRELGGTILSCIYDNIRNGQSVKQYISCVREILRTSPMVVRDHSSPTLTMIGHIGRMQVPHGVEMVKALSPVISLNMPAKNSIGLRDNLIIILHKDLVHTKVDTRLIAVNGMLHLLANVEIRNMSAISQSSSSQYNTQPATRASIEHGASSLETEKTTCVQLLRWLNRCFKQQAEVKLAFYNGLCKSISKNPELLTYVHETLLNHVKDYYNEGIVLPPLDFDKTVELRDAGARLVDPLGNLVLVIHQLITRMEEETTNGPKLREILDSLVVRMPKSSLEEFQLTDASELVDVLPESCQKREIVCQIISVYEALMSYVVDSWDLSTVDQGKKLVALFKGYHRIIEFTKSSAKARKLEGNDGRKGRNKDKDKDADNNDTKKTNPGSKPALFKQPATVIELVTVCKMLQLIFEESVSWSTDGAINQIKSNHDLQKYVVQIALELVKSAQTSKENQPANMNYFIQLGIVLYQRVICDLQQKIEYDLVSTLLCLECFNELLTLIGDNYKTRIDEFIDEVAGIQRGGENQMMKMITMVESLLEKLLTTEEEDAEPGVKKVPQLLVPLLRFLSHQLPPASSESKEVLNWLKTFATDTTIRNTLVANGVLQLLLDLNQRYFIVTSGQLLDDLTSQLQQSLGISADYDDTVQQFSSLAIVTSENENQAIIMLCNAIKQLLGEVDWIVGRITAEFCAKLPPMASSEDYHTHDLKDKERGACLHLALCVKLVNCLARTNFPEVDGLETCLLKLMISLYLSLTGLTKYFITRSIKDDPTAFKQAKFEQLVTLCGNHLSVGVNGFIQIIQNKDSKKVTKRAHDVSESKNKSRIILEGNLLSRVAFQKEQFEANIVRLTNKSKINLMQLIKVNGARDFRLKKDVMRNLNDQTVNQTSIDAEQSEVGTSRRNATLSKTVDDSEEPKKKKRRQN